MVHGYGPQSGRVGADPRHRQEKRYTCILVPANFSHPSLSTPLTLPTLGPQHNTWPYIIIFLNIQEKA